MGSCEQAGRVILIHVGGSGKGLLSDTSLEERKTGM